MTLGLETWNELPEYSSSGSSKSGEETRLVLAVCFQTACQNRLFKSFPEVIIVDTTHGTNKNYYKLFSILVDDVFGKVKKVLSTSFYTRF